MHVHMFINAYNTFAYTKFKYVHKCSSKSIYTNIFKYLHTDCQVFKNYSHILIYTNIIFVQTYPRPYLFIVE